LKTEGGCVPALQDIKTAGDLEYVIHEILDFPG